MVQEPPSSPGLRPEAQAASWRTPRVWSSPARATAGQPRRRPWLCWRPA